MTPNRSRRAPPPPLELRRGSQVIAFERPVLMGVINATPDSFSDGGQYATLELAVAQAKALLADGADLLDIGGESTRPGAEGVSAEVERERVVPIIEALRAEGIEAPLSVDTSKASVAAAALAAGADLVNDVTALRDPAMAPLLADTGAPAVLMHMRGEPRTMQTGPLHYGDVVADVARSLRDALGRAEAAGVAADRVLFDPGIGFGKTVDHNLTLTRRLGELCALGRPVVYGPSRKRFLGEVTGRDVGDRERATAAACAVAVLAGAHVLRVHDIAAVRDAVTLAAAIRDAP